MIVASRIDNPPRHERRRTDFVFTLETPERLHRPLIALAHGTGGMSRRQRQSACSPTPCAISMALVKRSSGSYARARLYNGSDLWRNHRVCTGSLACRRTRKAPPEWDPGQSTDGEWWRPGRRCRPGGWQCLDIAPAASTLPVPIIVPRFSPRNTLAMPKSDQNDLAMLVQHDVGRFHISKHDRLRVLWYEGSAIHRRCRWPSARPWSPGVGPALCLE